MSLFRKTMIGVFAAIFSVAGAFSTANAQTVKAHMPKTMAHLPIHIKYDATSTYQHGLRPSQIKNAYGVNQLSNTGAGQTIAIVDAYGSPSIQQDLQAFDQEFGLPAANLQIAYPGGKPHKSDGGWALETSMDVEWAHALSPDATIMLVVAPSASLSDLLSAVDYATSHGAQVVSNSYGSSEFSSVTNDDSHFNHSGVAYVASAGDSGSEVEWPAVSPDVIAVGGTTLNVDNNGNYLGESAWSGSGGGTSNYESRPSYQNNWTSVVGSSRGVPDVSFDADPNSGVAVYDTTRDQGQAGWFQVGGTSLGAPCWAALIALSDQGRTTPLSSFQALSDLYQIAGLTGSTGYRTDYHDITSGSNGFNAQSGYDLVTGLGSPQANQLIPNLEQ